MGTTGRMPACSSPEANRLRNSERENHAYHHQAILKLEQHPEVLLHSPSVQGQGRELRRP